MNKAPEVRKRAFFDNVDGSETVLWQQATPETFSKAPKRLEESFYLKEDLTSNQWDNCTLFMVGSCLVCKTKKKGNNVRYLNLEENFYKVDVIKVVKKKGERKNLVGFSISRNGNAAEFLSKKSSVFLKWRNELAKFCVMTDLEENYKTLSILGSGGYGKVFLLEESLTKMKWAGKFIKINPQKSREKQLTMVKNEIKALRSVDHPNILKLHELYESEDQICMITEYVSGGRLFDEIVRTKGVYERETALIMKQLFSALSYLEYKDIIHRDIKPENILFNRNSQGQIKIKLIDFGLATFHTKRDMIKKGGTAGYVAPEILNNEPYDFKADLYSAGVIMYTCLTGKPLFYAINYADLLEKNKKGILKFGGKSWNKISNKARDLLQNILEPNPARRLSLSQAMSHPWLAAELTIQERGEMFEVNQKKYGNMDVPKDKTISKIPESLQPINQFIKTSSNPELPNLNSVGSSATWLTSRYALESGNYLLNSFYKCQSKGSDTTERSNNDLEAHDAKANILNLPNQKGLAQQRSLPAPSLTSVNPEGEKFKYDSGYNIKIHTINSFTELDSAPTDEEDDPCSQKYAGLKSQNMFFGRLRFPNSKPQRAFSIPASNKLGGSHKINQIQNNQI